MAYHLFSRLRIVPALLLLVLLPGCRSTQRNTTAAAPAADTFYLLVGSYASPQSEGVKVYAFDQENGSSRYVCGLKGLSNPSYLTVSHDGKKVYAVGEEEDTASCAHVLSFDATTGALTLLGTQPTHGAAPCYITLSPQEDYLLTANYLGANITLFPLDSAGLVRPGRTLDFRGHGADAERQSQPHLHCVAFTPDQRYLLANDLGTDRIHCFPLNKREKFSATPLLSEAEVFDITLPAGSGPRHIDFAPDGRHAYLITELSGEVLVFDYGEKGLQPIQTVRADTLYAQGSADIHVSPDGRHLYASNRLKGDGVAIFAIDSRDGTLTKVGYRQTGAHPRNFIITPNGKYLLVACRDTNEIELYARDSVSGLLSDTGERIETEKPVCLKFVPQR